MYQLYIMCYNLYQIISGPTTVPPEVSEAFKTVLVCGMEQLQRLDLLEDCETSALLKGLQTAKAFDLPAEQTNGESLISGVTLSGVEFDQCSVQPSTLFFRKCYPALLKRLLKTRYSVLIGNPGISKSWLHWYILYCVVNGNVVNGFNPRLIVRQVAESIGTELGRIYYTLSVNAGLNLLSDGIQTDAALLLIEPEASLTEPRITGVQTILTCSPDQKRYKEFQKSGAAKCFMPVWKLDELQLVAAHLHKNTDDQFLKEALTPKEIKKQYSRFGGIFHYVIPINEEVLTTAEREQEMVLANAKASDTFIWGADIEKRDDNKENISHFLLQYNVNEDTFMNFTMMNASEYVEKEFASQRPNNTELHDCITELLHMFRGGKKNNSFI